MLLEHPPAILEVDVSPSAPKIHSDLVVEAIDPVKVTACCLTLLQSIKVLAESEPVITVLHSIVVTVYLSFPVTPLNPEPSPLNEVAVTIPEKVAFPFDLMVAAVPTSKPSVALTIPTALTSSFWPEVTRSFSTVPPV